MSTHEVPEPIVDNGVVPDPELTIAEEVLSESQVVEVAEGAKEAVPEVSEEKAGPSRAADVGDDEENPAKRACKEDLESLGYYFDKEGVLRTTENKEKVGRLPSQAAYEQLGDTVTEAVFEIMKSPPYNLQCVTLEPSGVNFYASQNYKEAATLVVLVHGTGVVRAGQWARRLIINNSLNEGTMLPMIKEFQNNKNYAVVLLNYNETTKVKNPVANGCLVWDELTEDKIKADKIVVIAHSFGGYVTLKMLQSTDEDERVKAVILTDSSHEAISYALMWDEPPACRHWVTSEKALDAPLKANVVSAGTTVHEETTLKATESIYEFIQEALESS
ncbi:hypothetical protein L596_011790 [Steinernema carpocapsae]|uniref:Arb2 domain-containing protein n=1 Tax=Steinernema carpocapsae TaxID=34508 RepID=A0A4U5NVD8_STECR|nr:hypothetical protein L596_011790 [Steinernema carpocapsae]